MSEPRRSSRIAQLISKRDEAIREAEAARVALEEAELAAEYAENSDDEAKDTDIESLTSEPAEWVYIDPEEEKEVTCDGGDAELLAALNESLRDAPFTETVHSKSTDDGTPGPSSGRVQFDIPADVLKWQDRVNEEDVHLSITAEPPATTSPEKTLLCNEIKLYEGERDTLVTELHRLLQTSLLQTSGAFNEEQIMMYITTQQHYEDIIHSLTKRLGKMPR